MVKKLIVAKTLIVVGLTLGVGVREKVRLVYFLFVGRLFTGKVKEESKSFNILCLGTEVVVHIRNNFSDSFILDEVFRHNEYEDDLPAEEPHTIFDIGANVGLITVYLKVRYPHANIYCFEPDPENYKQLLLNTKELSGVQSYQVAISNENRSMAFYQSPLFHMRNSLLPIENAHKIIVQSITLDEAITLTKVKKVGLMKFDVEGGERDFFTTNAPYSRIESIVGELHPYRMDDSEYEVLLSHMKKNFILHLRKKGKKVFVYGTAR